eukprot:NODE_146_length_15710_cov_0.617385.p3 type:complete len:239 gc:universal NODE_146_length_15710_cov_0.617385:13966-14682(+)
MFISGFGPFQRIKDNPSFNAVKNLLTDRKIALLPRDAKFISQWKTLIHFYGKNVKVYLHSDDDTIKSLFSELNLVDALSESNLEIYFDFPPNFKLLAIPCVVAYDYVAKMAEFYWSFPFKYAIHVGVGHAGNYKLELLGNVKYSKTDIYGNLPQLLPKTARHTILPIPQVFNRLSKKYKVDLSCDAGGYVCDYTMAISNHFSHGKSVFIHVPSDGDVSEMTDFIKDVIKIIDDNFEQI